MTAEISTPLLSIGMPVYNGENFIGSAVNSILAQSFTDFELVISDNASTDTTSNICKDLAARDSRIRFVSNHKNIGASANFRKVFHECKGNYFKWAAHDDELAPDYLAQCVDALEKDYDVVLCHSQVKVIDEKGTVIGHEPIDASPLESDSAQVRFSELIRTDLDNYEVFGVIRRSVLERTPLVAGFIASDRTLRAELGLYGKFCILSDPLFLCRDHAARSIRAMPAHHQRAQWFDPNIRKRFCFPHWRILAEYFKCISRAETLSPQEKLYCRISIVKWLGIHQNWARLLADPLLVLFPGLDSQLIRLGRIFSR